MKVYTGTVEQGSSRGRTLGYPTANISLKDDSVSGVYAARVFLGKDEASYVTAAFADIKRKILEAHLLDFSDDLYGMEIKIELHKKIRENKEFSNDDELRAAITEDVANVRKYFKN